MKNLSFEMEFTFSKNRILKSNLCFCGLTAGLDRIKGAQGL